MMYCYLFSCYEYSSLHACCSYKNINVRLRKLNRPELDVSMKRLKLRGSIGDEIEEIMRDCGFERIKCLISSTTQEEMIQTTDDCKKTSSPTTEWNRTLYLYLRNESNVNF